MANSKTVLFPIEISYKAADGSAEIHKFALTLSLTLEEVDAAEGCGGQITVNGAVMPVDDQPLAVKPVDEAPQGEEMQQAA